MKAILKEIFIMCLLCVVITLVLGILFYEYTPTKKALPNMISYEPNEKIANQIEEIDLATKNSTIIQTYRMGSSDLTMYKAQNLYVSGKKDPFADYKVEESTTNTSTTQPNSSDNAQSSNNRNNTSGNQNNNNGSNSGSSGSSTNTSSTGSFFEKPGVK